MAGSISPTYVADNSALALDTLYCADEIRDPHRLDEVHAYDPVDHVPVLDHGRGFGGMQR